MSKKVQLYLAGAKNLEKKILEDAELHNIIMEDVIPDEIGVISDVSYRVKTVAYNKAEALAKKHKEEKRDNGIIIAMDSALSYDGKMIATSDNAEENKRILMQVSNETISIYTGVCILFRDINKTVKFFEETKVKFKELPKDYIEKYVTTHQKPLDTPESVISNSLACFIDRIEGTYDNLKGVPVATIYQMISKMGYSFESFE